MPILFWEDRENPDRGGLLEDGAEGLAVERGGLYWRVVPVKLLWRILRSIKRRKANWLPPDVKILDQILENAYLRAENQETVFSSMTLRRKIALRACLVLEDIQTLLIHVEIWAIRKGQLLQGDWGHEWSREMEQTVKRNIERETARHSGVSGGQDPCQPAR